MGKIKEVFKDVSSFEDFCEQMKGKEILIAYNKIQPTYCLEVSHCYYFSFLNGYTEEKLNNDIQNNKDMFNIKLVKDFYYPNTNMFSEDNSQRNIRGEILTFK